MQFNCENSPRVIVPSAPNKYLYVKVNGVIMRHSSRRGNETIVASVHCGTPNRIMVHTALYSAIICPYTSSSRYDGLVEVFSEGWALTSLDGRSALPVEYVDIDRLGRDVPRTVAVEFVGKESASYSVMWLEISRR